MASTSTAPSAGHLGGTHVDHRFITGLNTAQAVAVDGSHNVETQLAWLRERGFEDVDCYPSAAFPAPAPASRSA